MLMLFIVLTVILSQLHLLRNITSMYIAAYFGCFALTIVIAALTLRSVDRGSSYLLKLVSILYVIPCVAIVPGLLSGAPYSAASLGVGLGRLFFTLPIFVVVLLMPRTERNIRVLMVTVGILTIIASLTIPYQFVAGPILWFADAAGRAGLVRFASLFGSLTVLGIVCGMGILICGYSFRSATAVAIALLSIALGAVLSLSKAALVNVAYAAVVMPFVRRTTRRELVVFLIFVAVLINLVVILFGDQLQIFWSSIRFTDLSSGSLGDVSISGSIVDRLTALPMIAIRFHGPFSLLLGVGPIGGAGTFGFAPTVVPTVHNGLVELLLVGGIPMLVWYLWVNKVLVRASIAVMRSPGGKKAGLLCLFIFANLFINSIFSTSIMFQPIGALFFAVALKVVATGVFPAPAAPRIAALDSSRRGDGAALAPEAA